MVNTASQATTMFMNLFSLVLKRRHKGTSWEDRDLRPHLMNHLKNVAAPYFGRQ
jgi:hypothetical protein